MNINTEKTLLGLNNEYQDQVQKCNKKYDELVREYRTQHSIKNSNITTKVLVFLLSFSCVGISCLSCIASCSGDWLNCSSWGDSKTIMTDALEGGLEMWFEGSGGTILIIVGIVFLLCVCEKFIFKTRNNRIENSINELERERKRELEKIQEKYEYDRQQINTQYNQNGMNN